VIAFTVVGEPVSKARPRLVRTKSGGVFAYTPRKTREFEAVVRQFALSAMSGRNPLDEPLRVVVRAYVGVPASWSKKRREEALNGAIRPAVKPDLDNLLKSVFDAMNGVVFSDDSRIVAITAEKMYSDVPRVEVEVYKE